MRDFAGPFLGFTFDNIHSSELNIVRVANSNRYTDNLAPDIQDVTVAVPNGDGIYYFGTTYGKRSFSINIAFDSLTERQLVKLRQVFNGKGLHRLVFDEAPYKYYTVKVPSAPSLSYVPFDIEWDGDSQVITNKADLYGMITDDFYEGAFRIQNKGRIYKGEGTIQFTAFEPYAHSTYKYKDELYRALQITNQQYDTYDTSLNIGSLSEWYDSRDWVKSTYIKNDLVIDQPGTDGCVVYNAGDVETPFIYKLYTSVPTTIYNISIPTLQKCRITESYNFLRHQWQYDLDLKQASSYTNTWTRSFTCTDKNGNNVQDLGHALSNSLKEYTATGYSDIQLASIRLFIREFVPTHAITYTQTISIIEQVFTDPTTVSLSLDSQFYLAWNNLKLANLDVGIAVNTKLHLIEGIDANGNSTGTVYNQYITRGDFFNLPVMDQPMLLTTTGVAEGNTPEIVYDYLYY